MKIRLLTVGQKMPKWVQQTFSDYNNRLPKNQQIQLLEIAPVHRAKTMNTQKAMQIEGQNILAAIKPHEKVIIFDEHGKAVSTKYLANSIKNWQLQAQDVALIIGGADGFSQQVKEKADATWSLSQLTFPHPLVRVIVMEQIYRAYSLIANHPYHRE
ncbi:MAG TPA: 23S rRNA (pseudouridine(1915)-N(3))-methyltransferase RlmH [Oceanospirillales bacterium]|nr:23S rRNA (pseudouridine(1915)-N(3))-methyltransferase RlmH [Oceanospirillales bacterium]